MERPYMTLICELPNVSPEMPDNGTWPESMFQLFTDVERGLVVNVEDGFPSFVSPLFTDVIFEDFRKVGS